jgi:hypothetical protein
MREIGEMQEIGEMREIGERLLPYLLRLPHLPYLPYLPHLPHLPHLHSRQKDQLLMTTPPASPCYSFQLLDNSIVLRFFFFFYIQRINLQNYPDTTYKVLKDGKVNLRITT